MARHSKGGSAPLPSHPPTPGCAGKPALERRSLRRAGRAIAGLLGVCAWLASAGPSAAQESGGGSQTDGSAQSRPPLLLNLTRPLETPERALQQAVREDARAPRASGSPDVEVLPDGSVRIGRTRISVTVKEECPEEPHTPDMLPRPLPGRSRR